MATSASIFRLKRGDHICVFYHDDAALLQTLCPYLAEGLRNGERCFCAQRQDLIPLLLRSLSSYGVNVESEMRRAALEIHSPQDVYLPDSRFRPKALMKLLETSIRDARQQGFTGFRTAGDLSWTATGACDCDQLIAYEQLVQASFSDTAAVGMCQYRIPDFSSELLERVLESHQLSLSQTMAQSNHSSLRLRYGNYHTDIVADRLNPESKFYYVIQRAGAKEILSWGSAASLEAALTESEGVVNQIQAG
jgi:hypothetical protein